MKSTPALKLSTRLVAFVTMFVVTAMFIIFIGGTLTLKKMGVSYVTSQLQDVTQIIDEQVSVNPDLPGKDYWLPKLMRSHSIIEMQMERNGKLFYQYKDPNATDTALVDLKIITQSYDFQLNPSYSISFKASPPYADQFDSSDAFASLTFAVLFVVFCLFKGVKWLKEQLIGSELLEERGRMLLAGELEKYAVGDESEWPHTASQALNRLVAELQDARQERSRFDTFIRTHTFLDQLTGAANRVLFDSKLESTLQESGNNGAVMVMAIRDWDEIKAKHTPQECDAFILSVARTLSNLSQRYPQAVFSRYYEAQFALLISHQSVKEITRLAQQSLKQLEKLNSDLPEDPDNWCHIGLSFFGQGERRGKILNEAEMALREAQVLGVNTWGKYKKNINKTDEYKGQVRWRNLFDQVFEKKEIYLFEQIVYSVEGDERQIFSREIFARIKENNEIIKASHFSNALEQVGYQARFDKLTIETAFKYIRTAPSDREYSLNLFTQPFSKKEYKTWFRDFLLQQPKSLLKRLSFEFVEGEIIADLDKMRPILHLISALGAKVIIEQVGRTIVSTHYLKGIKVDAIKIHRSLVKQIDKRSENQLFIRSLIGACQDIEISAYAVGIENEQECKVLNDVGIHVIQGRYFSPEMQVYPDPSQKSKITDKVKRVMPGRRNRWRQ